MEGRGVGGQAVEAAELAAKGRTGRRRHRLPGQEGLRDGSLSSSDGEGIGRRHHHGLTEGVRTVVSNEGEAYCPNPNIRDLVSNAKLVPL